MLAAGSQGLQQTPSVFSLRETTVFRTFEFLRDDIDLVGGPLMLILTK